MTWPIFYDRQELLSNEVPRLCARVGLRTKRIRPYRKRRVDRSIGYLRQSFWRGLRFTDLENLNRQVKAWCDAVSNRRLHGTTQKRLCDLLLEEGLRPVPNRAALVDHVPSKGVGMIDAKSAPADQQSRVRVKGDRIFDGRCGHRH